MKQSLMPERAIKGSAMNEQFACCLDQKPVERFSVWTVSDQEAVDFKWIESEKAGHDLGEDAMRMWVRKHWWGFLRARWVEHLQGSRFWIELDQDDFGLVNREFPDHRSLLNDIVTQVKNGKENLDIIRWAEDRQIPVGPVLAILERLNINGHRIIHYFDNCKL